MVELSSNFLFPLLVAVISYLLLNKLDEWRKRREQSILGSVIIDSIIEEVKGGQEIIINTLTAEDFMDPRVPPRKSWDGMSTIPDDVLLRIIATTKNVRPKSFPPREIRTHLKNYFDHMLTNWDRSHDQQPMTPQAYLKLNFPTYKDAVNGVLTMLMQTKQILNENSKKWIPD